MSHAETKKKHRLALLDRLYGGDPAPLAGTKPTLNEQTLVNDVYEFWSAHPDFYQRLFHAKEDKLLGFSMGKGELLLYFIFDDAQLGGPTSPIDLLKHDPQVGSVAFAEVKAAKRYADGRMHSFRLGSEAAAASYLLTQGVHELLARRGQKFMADLGIEMHTEVKRSVMKKLWRDPDFQDLECRYYELLLSGVLGTHPVVFFDTATGMIVSFKRLKRENLQLERISGGQARLIVNPNN